QKCVAHSVAWKFLLQTRDPLFDVFLAGRNLLESLEVRDGLRVVFLLLFEPGQLTEDLDVNERVGRSVGRVLVAPILQRQFPDISRAPSLFSIVVIDAPELEQHLVSAGTGLKTGP